VGHVSFKNVPNWMDEAVDSCGEGTPGYQNVTQKSRGLNLLNVCGGVRVVALIRAR